MDRSEGVNDVQVFESSLFAVGVILLRVGVVLSVGVFWSIADVG